MYQGSTIGVVIPVYNEEAFIGDVIESIPAFVDRVYVVDDCSTDDTWARICDHVTEPSTVFLEDSEERRTPEVQIAGSGSGESGRDQELLLEGSEAIEDNDGPGQEGRTRSQTDGGQVAPTFVPIRHERNRGRGGAVKTGYWLAMKEGLDVVAVMDGDGQMDPDILDRIVEPVVDGTADYAKGNRLVDSDHWAEMTRWRLFGNALLTLLTKIASGYWDVRDPQNGYTAISVEALEEIELGALYEDYGFLNDLLVRLSIHEMAVEDVPMKAVYGDEESGISYSSFVPSLSALLLWDFLWRLRRTHLT